MGFCFKKPLRKFCSVSPTVAYQMEEKLLVTLKHELKVRQRDVLSLMLEWIQDGRLGPTAFSESKPSFKPQNCGVKGKLRPSHTRTKGEIRSLVSSFVFGSVFIFVDVSENWYEKETDEEVR